MDYTADVFEAEALVVKDISESEDADQPTSTPQIRKDFPETWIWQSISDDS